MLVSKGLIDLKVIPQSLINLRRALILFFLTILSTAVALLAVSYNSNIQFKKDSVIIENAI